MPVFADLKTSLLQTLRHTLILGAGWIVATAIRLFLLPVFTRYLDTTEYGTVVFLDSAVGLARIVLVAGITSALMRFFNQEKDSAHRYTVVSIGIRVLLVIAVTAGFVLTLTAEPIGSAVLGVDGQTVFILLAGAEMLVGLPRLGAESFLTATRRSTAISMIIALQALCSAAVNLWLVVSKDLGVYGILVGNLSVSTVFSVGLTAWTLRTVGWRFERNLFVEMLRFGLPMVPALLSAAAMHQVDRLLIRIFSSMEQVGIYSIGHMFPFMLNSILIQNFERIWGGSLMFEIARAPDATYQFRRMCTYTMFALGIALVGTAIGARSIVLAFTGPAFHGASQYIPPIALGVWIYSMHVFVRTGVVLTKKTYLFPINYGLACAINIGLNVLLIPSYGAMGAAWASVAAYSWFSIGGFFVYRRCYRVEIEWLRLSKFMVACIAVVILREFVPAAGFLQTLATDIGFFLLVPAGLLLWPGFLTSGERSAILELIVKSRQRLVRARNTCGNA